MVIRFSSIGDIVLTTPVLRALKRQIPGVEVHYLTRKAYEPILAANPYVDKVFFLKKSLGDTAEELKREHYYRIIDLHNNQRTFLLKALLGTKSYAFPKLNFEKWLMVNFKINKLPETHIVDRYMETLVQLGVTRDGEGLDYFIPPQDEVDVQTLPSAFQNGYVAFAIGAQHYTKRFPLDRVIEVCKLSKLPIVLLGGPEDAEEGEKVAKEVGEGVYNACGKYSINGSASLVRQATKVVTNDTGLMHIAAAFHKTIVSLWGNTIPEFGMYPYYGDNDNTTQAHVVEVGELDCRPCSKIGFDKCPRGHFNCMEQLDVATIAGLIDSQ